ncbi:type IV toxin-antitoxin system AbiEi family antitoxin domain-containing protein [Paeniglutamicibacter sp.]|uniref:type IV toxin-antitoxin system AbiEi family antitoxin domain-containing protein n=1 Tax=Paeniglutamicibacter sp. TaxID=1934391 RepID=UPI00398A1E30
MNQPSSRPGSSGFNEFPDADWDLVEAATRKPLATICLLSALAHHDLTDEIPTRLHVALPRGMHKPADSLSTALSWHVFSKDTFNVCRTTLRIPGTDLDIGLYEPERAIADAFRFRSTLGHETGRDALKEWLRRGGKPAHLLWVAEQLPNARKPVSEALWYLA